MSDQDRYSDFDIFNGCLYLTCAGAGPYGLCAAYCFYNRMTSQEVYFDSNRLHFKYDCICMKEDKLIPLDRIQDVNIGSDCCARMCGVSILSVQTANGSAMPEAVIIAPRDPIALRTMIMNRRDGVAGSSGGGVDNPLPTASAGTSRELVDMRDILQRMEKLMEKGLEHFEKKEFSKMEVN